MQYTLAISGDDYEECYAFILGMGMQMGFLEHPTVMVHNDDGAMVGVIGTSTEHDMVRCAPIILGEVPGKNRGVIVKLMIDQYEQALRDAGVSCYWFSVKTGHPFQRMADKLVPCSHVVNDDRWYERKIGP